MMRALVVVAVMVGGVAHADPEATAKVLFDEGKTLFAEGKYGKACDRLEASFKLNALSGTRGLLAACYEKVGKLASAWNAYRDSAAIAERQGNAERAQVARDKAAELEPQLARITIDASAVAKTSGVVIKIDGVEQPAAALGRELPIDGGPHVLEANAPDHKPWRTTIDIQDREKQKVAVGALVPDPTRRLLLESRMREEQQIAHRRKTIAYGLLGGGGASLAVAVTLGVMARSEWSRAKDLMCADDGTCPSAAGKQEVDRAATKADLATYLGAGGLALVGAGVFVYLTSPKPRTEPAGEAGALGSLTRGPELRLVPTVTPSAASLVVEGRF